MLPAQVRLLAEMDAKKNPKAISKRGLFLGTLVKGNNSENEGSRSLLSDTTINIESYTRQRIFKADQLGYSGKEKLFQTLQTLSSPKEARQMMTLILDSFHSAESQEECNIIESVLRLLRLESESGNKEFHFGATLFRMHHFFGMFNKALALYKDPQLKTYFEDNTCHMILMDLLYKHQQYHSVMEVFEGLQRFDTNCYTIALGALYHINTSESHRQSEAILKRAQQSNIALQRRAVMFSAMLALNQGKAKEALDCLSLCRPNNVTNNIKLICQCRLQHFQDVFKTLEKFLQSSEDTTQIMRNRIYQDTWLEIQSLVRKSDSTDVETLKTLEEKLRQAGVLSLQNTHVFLERLIPGEKDYKKQRAKRLIDRTNVINVPNSQSPSLHESSRK